MKKLEINNAGELGVVDKSRMRTHEKVERVLSGAEGVVLTGGSAANGVARIIRAFGSKVSELMGNVCGLPGDLINGFRKGKDGDGLIGFTDPK
jgi:hypothetical protein